LKSNLLIFVAAAKFSNFFTFSQTNESGDNIPRCKPLKYTYEKEIVMYAYFKKLHYFSTECIFAPNAYRGHARTFLKDLEKIRPSVIMDILHSGKEDKKKKLLYW